MNIMGVELFGAQNSNRFLCVISVSVLFLSAMGVGVGKNKKLQRKTFDATGFLCREYKKIQLSLAPRTVPVVMKTLHRAEKLLKDELPESDKSLGVLRGRRR